MRACVLIIFCAALSFAAYRPYDYVLSGSRSTGMGAAGTTLLASPESVIYNPAALSRISWGEFFYEALAVVRIQRLATYSYDVRFDYVYFTGATIPVPDTSLTFAVSVSTLFSENERPGIADKGRWLTFKEIGFSAAFSPLPTLALGITVGPVIGLDNGTIAVSGFVHAGMLANPLPPWLIGLSFTSPIPISWASYYGSVRVEEVLPYSVRLGNSCFITPDIGLYLDLEFQGWHAASFTADGVVNRIDNRGEVIAFAKTFHPHIGVEFYDRNAIANNLGGGVWRFGFFTRSSFTASGDSESRYMLTFGTTVFAGKFIRFSASMNDSFLLGQLINPSVTAIEELRVTIEINLGILSGKSA